MRPRHISRRVPKRKPRRAPLVGFSFPHSPIGTPLRLDPMTGPHWPYDVGSNDRGISHVDRSFGRSSCAACFAWICAPCVDFDASEGRRISRALHGLVALRPPHTSPRGNENRKFRLLNTPCCSACHERVGLGRKRASHILEFEDAPMHPASHPTPAGRRPNSKEEVRCRPVQGPHKRAALRNNGAAQLPGRIAFQPQALQ